LTGSSSRRVATAIKLAVRSPREFRRVLRFRHGPPRIRTLVRLVRERKPRTILEIGVWRGETARRLIQEARRHNDVVQYWGYDLFDQGMTDEILRREVSLRPLGIAEIEAQLISLGAQVTLVAGDSTSTVPNTEMAPIDFAFIDGGHSYETVAADWRNVEPRLSSDAMVVFDDYTNAAAVEHEGYGIRALVDELERLHEVQLLKPVDTFPRDYGVLETQLAVLRVR
jgi:predicted O-methyltransferase YrrM